MVERFLEYIAVEKRYSPHTLTSYSKDLEDFSRFHLETEGHEDLVKADKKIVRNFMVHLSEKKISKRSINRKLSSLRSFYIFLLKVGEINTSPLENIKSLKFYAEKQIPFSEEEMEQHKTAALKNENQDLLKKLIIETLYQTGMRRAELVNLLLKNVDFGKSEIKVIGKGNKARIIPASEKLLKQMAEYLHVRKPLREHEMYFFINAKGKKLNDKFVYSAVNNYLSLVTSKKKKKPSYSKTQFCYSRPGTWG